jgi:hypothetical protein
MSEYTEFNYIKRKYWVNTIYNYNPRTLKKRLNYAGQQLSLLFIEGREVENKIKNCSPQLFHLINLTSLHLYLIRLTKIKKGATRTPFL